MVCASLREFLNNSLTLTHHGITEDSILAAWLAEA